MNADFQSFDPASSLAAGLPRSTLRARGAGLWGETLLPCTPEAPPQREGRAPAPHAASACPGGKAASKRATKIPPGCKGNLFRVIIYRNTSTFPPNYTNAVVSGK